MYGGRRGLGRIVAGKASGGSDDEAKCLVAGKADGGASNNDAAWRTVASKSDSWLAATWPNSVSRLTKQDVATQAILILIRSVVAPQEEKTQD